MGGRSFYAVLKVDVGASKELIKDAYRAIAIETHPDVNGGCKIKTEQFKRATEAYGVLMDLSKRQEYDTSHGFAKGSPFYRREGARGGFYGKSRSHDDPLYASPPPPGMKAFDNEVWDAWHYGINGTMDPSMTNTNSFMDLGEHNRTQQYFMRVNMRRQKEAYTRHAFGRDDITRRMAERREKRREANGPSSESSCSIS